MLSGSDSERNPSYIRKVTGLLRKKEIITSRQGARGFALTVTPEELPLYDIYRAIYESEEVHVFDLHQMIPDLLLGSTVFLYSIPEKDFEIFRQAALEAQEVEFAMWENSIKKAKKSAQQLGVVFLEVNVDDFRKKVAPIHEYLLKTRPEIKELYDKARAIGAQETEKK